MKQALAQLKAHINEVKDFLQPYVSEPKSIGIILGSGLGQSIDEVKNKVVIPYQNIPHLPECTAIGHSGNLIIGQLAGKSVIIMQGRFHLYEGHKPLEATLLLRALKLLGVETLIITAASGALNDRYQAGELMLIDDHINFSGTNPLIGPNLDEFGPRFLGMFDIYTPQLRKIAREVALDNKIQLNVGVYAGIHGPSYASRAELQMFINNGCDAIGMSVVHEATIAAHSGMKILGLVAITDMALPHSTHHATGEEVIESAKKIETKLRLLITKILECDGI